MTTHRHAPPPPPWGAAAAADPAIEIRDVGDDELDEAFALLRVLRPHVDAVLFRQRLERQRREHGYALVGAWMREAGGESDGGDGGARRLVGLIGLRANETMAWGPHVHVDDLVTDEAMRGRGVGRALMRWCEAEATRRGLPAVYLEARVTAIGFYDREGYVQHPSPVMKRERGDA